jgi:Xaa-Pro aminopeptidase
VGVGNDWWPRFSEAEYARRYARVRAAMDDRGLDALLVYGASIYFGSDPGGPNLTYLSGYAPGCHGYVVFPRVGDPTLLVYVPSHGDNAREMSVVADVRAGNDIAGLAVARLRELELLGGAIGIVGNFDWSGTSVPLEHFRTFEQQLPNATLEIVTTWYEDLRLLKSAEELAFMRTGAAICDRTHEALREMTRPGVTDNALHNEVLRLAHELGGRIPFSHVGSTSMRNPHLLYPSFYPVNRVVGHGDVVLTELAAGYGSYFGKIYGTLAIGDPTPAYRRMFELAADIYRKIYELVKPGITAGDTDSFLGGDAGKHGLQSWSYVSGWSTYNTRPAQNRVAPRADKEMELKPGHCLNVAGWIVDPDAKMGVWLGDTAVMADDGLRPLHAYRVADLDYVVV